MTQPSGWYDDPQDPGSLRYWDGILWTGHTVPKTSPTAAASTIGRPVPPPVPPGYAGAPTTGPAPTGGPSGAMPTATPGPGYDRPPPTYGYGSAPSVAWPQSGPTSPDGMPLAQWWQRLLARIIDGLLVGFVAGIVASPWLLTLARWYLDTLARAVRDAERGVPTTLDEATLNALVTEAALPLTLATIAVGVLYETFCLTRWGATLGKRALGIAVRRVARAGPLTLVEALRRQLIQQGTGLLGLVRPVGLIMTLVQFVDVLWLLWDPRRQALHDKVSDTLVVRVRPGR